MNPKLAMGLVSAGSASQSFLTRVPSLNAHLGPIKAKSLKAAKQTAKLFHSAYSVSHFSALEMCQLIWVDVPERMLDHVMQDLAAQTPMERTMVVLCGCLRESTAASVLSKAGARVSSLNAVEESRERWFVGEGHPQVLALVKRILWADRRKLLKLSPGTKTQYFAGMSSASSLLLPWLDSSVRYLRAVGFSRAEAMHISKSLAQAELRRYEHAGAKSWRDSDQQTMERLIKDPPAGDAHLAALVTQGARQTLAHFAPGRRAASA